MTEQLETKYLIFSTYKKLSRTMPLKDISVKKLCAAANITRGSFYYYFSGIHDLINQIYHEEVIIPVKKHIRNHYTGISVLNLSLIYEDRDFYLQAFDYGSEPNLTTYFFEEAKDCWDIIYNRLLKLNPDLNEEEIHFIRVAIDYFADAHAYATLKWIRNGMKEDPAMISEAMDLAGTKGLSGLVDKLLL